MQPSSRRVGLTSARTSASSRVSWPTLGRKITTRVTAFLGSLAEAVGRDLRFDGRLFDFGLGIVAGLYSAARGQRKRKDPGRKTGER
jgi:hypothetical protein